MTRLTESAIEEFAIQLFESLGYNGIHGHLQQGFVQCTADIDEDAAL